MNWQIPIITEGENTNARIIKIITENVNKYLDSGGVAVIPGFQGISKSGDITSIGRGGSDATAVAIAKIFQTDSCEIYTDVDGVYSSDPNKIPLAKKIDKISYEEMLELSSLGGKSYAIFRSPNCNDEQYTNSCEIYFYRKKRYRNKQ